MCRKKGDYLTSTLSPVNSDRKNFEAFEAFNILHNVRFSFKKSLFSLSSPSAVAKAPRDSVGREKNEKKKKKIAKISTQLGVRVLSIER